MHADVLVIGGGIVGLAHAWMAARKGLSVLLFERHERAQGASIRNFGLIWPWTQPPGESYQLALRSRRHWLELSERAGLWLDPVGSLHLAYHDDEWAVLHEFAERAKTLGIECDLLTPRQTRQRSPAVLEKGLLGSLYSPSECCLDPREALARLSDWLSETYDVSLCFGETVVEVDAPTVRTARGDVYRAERVFVCSGVDFETLFPEVFAESGIRKCKLQMMRTEPQPNGWRLGPTLAGGLSMGHYAAFAGCPSLPKLRHRIETQTPEYVRLGIHVMAAQNQRGEVLLGDSHEYGEPSPFDSARIDELILNQLQRMLALPDWRIAEHWHGVYAKHPTLSHFEAEPQPGVRIVTATGGAGMTMAFGYAERAF